MIACEVPWDGNSGTPVPLILALASSARAAWPGASLYVDHGDGALLPLGPSGRTRATIGTALSALAAASPLLYDRYSSVVVDLAAADLTLTEATMRQLAMDANRALLGNEIVQFASAEPLGEGQWRLSAFFCAAAAAPNPKSTNMPPATSSHFWTAQEPCSVPKLLGICLVRPWLRSAWGIASPFPQRSACEALAFGRQARSTRAGVAILTDHSG